MKAVLSLGLSIPNDIALIGYDNINISKFLPISLSTIDTLGAEVGRYATETLINTILHPDAPVSQKTLKPKLIIRESTNRTNN